MKCNLYVLIILLVCVACNEEVFVKRPATEEAKPEQPSPSEPAEPVYTDSLVLLSLTYDATTLRVEDEELIYEGETTFSNYTSSTGVSILFDNYNSSFVNFTNSTHYLVPWAKESQPTVALPGIDAEGQPGFYGNECVFAPGRSVVRKQFMAGHIERFDLPPNSGVTAKVYTIRKIVKAHAAMTYINTEYPSIVEEGWWDVTVAVPVKIYVEWGDIIALK